MEGGNRNGSEIRACQNCKNEFRIEPDDFAFYQKIQVPPPTFCPECRLQRRLAFFNLTNLYHRKCDLCGEMKISMYPPEAPYKVYCPPCWWSDKWDPLDYGRDYEFSRSFFEQLNELWHVVPLLGLSLDLMTTQLSPHNNHAGHLKNCYLLFHADQNEDCAYGFDVFYSTAVFDCSLIHTSEVCYDTMHSYKNSRCVGLRSQATENLDCYFLRDSDGCQNCFASANLRNKKYYIFNKPYLKEQYFEEIKKWDLGSWKTYQEIKRLAEEHWKTQIPRSHFDDFSVYSTGTSIWQCKNVKDSFEVAGAEDSRFLLLAYQPPIRDCYDITSWGNNMQLCYECNVVGEDVSEMRFCQEAGIGNVRADYCKLSTGGSDHFGCVSVRKKQYVILNKSYHEEEYRTLRQRIIRHMNEMPYTDKRGRVYRYGEFFPIEMSPTPYNITVAQNFFPLTKEEALHQGYAWQEPEERQYTITLPTTQLPDHIRDVPDSILNETISCQKCGRGYKIIPMELKFLRERNLPLPRECPFCRINEKFDLWVRERRFIPRACDKCGKEFTTRYTAEEASRIYCKECYLREVV